MSAWGKVIQPTHPVSFTDVMSEELAYELAKEEHDYTTEDIPQINENEVDADLLLALKLSQQEEVKVPSVVNPTEAKSDEDFLLALKLQNEEFSKSHKSSSFTKVSLGVDDYQILPEDDEESDEEDYDDDEDAEIDALVAERAAAEYMVTKHDPVISGMKNAYSLGRTMNSGVIKTPLTNYVANSIKHSTQKQETMVSRIRGNRVQKATSEGVLDPKTRIALLKLHNAGIIKEMNGIISTGKEANVYHAIGGPKIEGIEDKDLAVKIYKTTLNEFKNRSQYLPAPLGNSRKLIDLWARQEIQNLRRLSRNGVPVPTPVMQRNNILIMGLVGKDGVAAPVLRDVELTEEKATKCYIEVIKYMRQMFQDCNLIHADFSDYNILYLKGHCVIIDVSQTVETNHGNAREFLENDVKAITYSFAKRGLSTLLSHEELMRFITAREVDMDAITKQISTVHNE